MQVAPGLYGKKSSEILLGWSRTTFLFTHGNFYNNLFYKIFYIILNRGGFG
jgi:hypothetical protein